MSFAHPEWLLAGALAIAALAAWLRHADRRRARDLARFASARLLGALTATLSRPRRRAKRAMLGTAIALLFVALAEPQVGERWEETHRRGIDVLIALDVSRSMLARDVVPDRLTRAKLAITDLAARLEGDRLGLIAFAGTAFLQCPLTLDHAAFLESLAALEPGIIEAPGSDLASALDVADQALRSEKHNVKLLVLVSDGEDLGGSAVAEAERVAREGVRVFTIGVGSAAGELVPASRTAAGSDFVKDEGGRYVQSRLDEATLRRIAEATGGFYAPLGQRGEGIDSIVDRAIAPIPKADLASRMRRVPVNRSAWPLAAAIALLAADLLLGERRRAAGWTWRPWRRSAPPTSTAPVRALILAALFAGAALAPRAAGASPQSAREAFEAGDFERALAEYRAAATADPSDPRLDFNAGAAAYRAGRFEDASAAFARALRSESRELQEQSFYNLGNAHFRTGAKALPADPQQAMRALQQAVDAYEQALALRTDDADARHNRDVARAALEELRKAQQQRQGKQDRQDDKGKRDERDAGDPQAGDPSAGDEGGDRQDGQQSAGRPDERRRDGSPDASQPPGESGASPGGDAGEKQERGESAAGGPKDEAPGGGGDRAAPDTPRAAGDPAESRTPGADADAPRPGREPAGDAHADRRSPGSPESAGAGEGEHGGAEAANPMPDAPTAGAAGAPGQLSADEARQLLDSLRSDEQRVPALAGSGGAPRAASGAVRDW